MAEQTIRDRFWLWGMKVNALQQTESYGTWGFGTSTMTVEDAIQRTGATNVIIAGHLPIDEETLASMPSARRIICKWASHRKAAGSDEPILDYDTALSKLAAAKRLVLCQSTPDG